MLFFYSFLPEGVKLRGDTGITTDRETPIKLTW
nr:MAG TPA: hypothetical protein [Caudoviricetes sp.]